MSNFPHFRILHGAEVMYVIHSPTRFTEWKRMGKFYSCNEVEANQYPEKVRIQDMLQCAEGFRAVGEAEFKSTCESWQTTLIRVAF